MKLTPYETCASFIAKTTNFTANTKGLFIFLSFNRPLKQTVD